jgi:7-keto-8-aminopelargonate synthetase-like enzyme
MSKTQSFIDTLQQIAKYGISKKIFHLYTDTKKTIQSNLISLEGKEVVNFGSCSYLGLEFDDRLKEASKKAIDDYGTQFSESRADDYNLLLKFYQSFLQYKNFVYICFKSYECVC